MEPILAEVPLYYKMQAVRYKGKWYKINPKPFEPERQTFQIAWHLIREPLVTKEEAYRAWFKREQQNVKVLYPSFRKENDS
jgi:lipocalin